jgi:ATP-dependent RNA helicase DeaD
MTSFRDFNLPTMLNESLARMGFVNPTPIQAEAIPLALAGEDILGSAQTGTGKTAAFALPLITHLINHPESTGLVLAPTRELAMQVIQLMHQLLGKKNSINSALLIGGESIFNQLAQLRRKPRLIVGTPGRINDHLQRGTLKLDRSDFLVLDETDRMLDMGFGIQIDEILKYVPSQRQTLMFSATLPREIIGLSNKYLINPKRVSVDTQNQLPTNVTHKIVPIYQGKKYDALLTELQQRTGSIIIFVRTRQGADNLYEDLRVLNYSVDKLHGDLRQSQRDRVIKGFRNQKYTILVATDVASRGLDIPHIEHVINYDLPQCPEDYIHRIGRTARAGAKGAALCFVSSDDYKKWKDISRLMKYEESEEMKKFFGISKISRTPSSGRNMRGKSKPAFFGGFEDSRGKTSKPGAKRANLSMEGSSKNRPFKDGFRSKANDSDKALFASGAKKRFGNFDQKPEFFGKTGDKKTKSGKDDVFMKSGEKNFRARPAKGGGKSSAKTGLSFSKFGEKKSANTNDFIKNDRPKLRLSF